MKQAGRKSKPSHSSAADQPSYDLLEAKEEGFFADATVTSESGKEVLTTYILVSDIIKIFHEYHNNPRVRQHEFDFLYLHISIFLMPICNLN